MAYQVLIPEDISEKGKQYLLDRGYVIKMGRGSSEEIICEDVVDCEALLVRNARYTKKIMEAGKRLKVIARHGTGTDNIDVEAATELGIQVVNGPAANIDTVAEYTVSLMLALSNDLLQIDRNTREGNWEFRKTYKRGEMHEKTVGIVGFGHIGQAVAKILLAAWKPTVLIYDGYVKEKSVPEGARRVDSLEELLKESDIVTLHVPSTPETRGMLGKNQFEMMKESAVLVNCARGDICEEKALCEALKNHVIYGAALDVFETEPLSSDSPLLELPHVIVSQHCAGLSAAATDRMALYAAQGVDEVLSGRSPSWPVNRL